jgi:putative hydrolase of the HAD superfamily
MSAPNAGRPERLPPITPKAVLFDLDDTLYPERQFVDGGFRAVARFIAQRHGGSEDALAGRLRELHARDGRGRLFDTLLDEAGIAPDRELVLACLLVYRTHVPRLQPFPGAVEALDALRGAGLLTGVLSDGQSAVQRRKLAGLPSVAERLDVVVMTDELGSGLAKPSPIGFRVACRLLQVPAPETVYVGNDPRKDFRGAREAGLFTIRVGRLPDEGGAVDIVTGGADDADLAVGSFDALSTMLLESSRPVSVRGGEAT